MMTATQLAELIINRDVKIVTRGFTRLVTAKPFNEFVYVYHRHDHVTVVYNPPNLIEKIEFISHGFSITRRGGSRRRTWRWVGKKPDDTMLGLLRLSL